ncbi:VOC family protein [Salibacterium aidingense]|uniref:VOC family protein n=1 Tax=Salibacterium aidingense TaxID=384933 RepID=UPI003BE34058
MQDVLPPDTMIGRVTLIVSDLTASLHFYREMLGFHVLEQTSGTAVLSADNKNALMVLEERTDAVPKPAGTSGLYHAAILVPDRPSLGLTLRRLLERGYPLQGAADHDFSEAIYLGDPDGNGLEIYRDRDRSQWKYDKKGWIHAPTVPLDADSVLREAEGKEWNGMPSGTVIGHIHLQVGDLEKSRTYYVNGLGFEPTVYMGSHALFVAAGGYHHHIGLNIWAGKDAPPPPEHAAGLKEYTVLLPDVQTLANVRHRLEQEGISYQQEKASIVSRDPSGNQVQLLSR